jgi:cell division inhibitor SulA
MNPILHDLQNKQWVWTAANAKQKIANTALPTGYENLDKVLSNGFPVAGMVHLQSHLGCGEMRLMLSVLSHQHKECDQHKLYMFIDPPFELNAEFLLAQNISLSQLVVIQTNKIDDALWSAEQSAKSGACHAIFMWQHKLKHIQVRKLEHAALQGGCYCVWLHNYSNSSGLSEQKAQYRFDHKLETSAENSHEQAPELNNLPLSLSLSIRRQNDSLNIKINKQKVGWAQKTVNIPLPFNSRTNNSFKYRKQHSSSDSSNVVRIHANN